CAFGDPGGLRTVVLWGDSHANQWVPGLDPLFRAQGIRGIERARAACLPALSGSTQLGKKTFGECKQFGDKVMDELLRLRGERPVSVTLAARWSSYVTTLLSYIAQRLLPHDWMPGAPAVEQSLELVTKRLLELGIPTRVLLQVPEQRYLVPFCLLKHPT